MGNGYQSMGQAAPAAKPAQSSQASVEDDFESMGFAEMDADCYLELFPNAAAFEAEFAEFWKDCIVPLAE